MNKKKLLKGVGALLLSLMMVLGGANVRTVLAASPFSNVNNYSTVIYKGISVSKGGTSSDITDVNEQTKVMQATEKLSDAYYTYSGRQNDDYDYFYWYCFQQDRNAVIVNENDKCTDQYGYTQSGKSYTYVGPDSKTYNRILVYVGNCDENKDGNVTFGEYLTNNGNIVGYNYENFSCVRQSNILKKDGYYNSGKYIYAFRLENTSPNGTITFDINRGDSVHYVVYHYNEASSSLEKVGDQYTTSWVECVDEDGEEVDVKGFDAKFQGDGLYVVVGLDINDDFCKNVDYSGLDIGAIKPGEDGTMYRMYNPNSGEHFYTANIDEAKNLKNVGWNYEGEAWVSPAVSDFPVYRLYNSNSGEHHYTTSAAERDSLVSIGWNDEGIGWYSASDEGTPLYRLYNPNAKGTKEAGSHHYTKDAGERDYLVSIGWNDEGIGWYGQ